MKTCAAEAEYAWRCDWRGDAKEKRIFQAFGYVEPDAGNDTWEIYKCLRLNDELIGILNELAVFKEAAKTSYRLR